VNLQRTIYVLIREADGWISEQDILIRFRRRIPKSDEGRSLMPELQALLNKMIKEGAIRRKQYRGSWVYDIKR
jgi:hypothetical protein